MAKLYIRLTDAVTIGQNNIHIKVLFQIFIIVKFGVPRVCESAEGIAVTRISFYFFSNAYIADQY